MCATIVGQAVVPLVGGKGHCTGRQTTSRRHWRYGTTRVCCSRWRSPLLTGAASLVRIFLPLGQCPELPRTLQPRTSENAPFETVWKSGIGPEWGSESGQEEWKESPFGCILSPQRRAPDALGYFPNSFITKFSLPHQPATERCLMYTEL